QQMKNLKGGIEDDDARCRSGSCFLYIQQYSQWFIGSCSWRGNGHGGIFCVCEAGGYETNNGGTSCNA
ncbi:MAG: hypothetical protein ABIP79_02490, partial [Chitinophagaceae bacterium]